MFVSKSSCSQINIKYEHVSQLVDLTAHTGLQRCKPAMDGQELFGILLGTFAVSS